VDEQMTVMTLSIDELGQTIVSEVKKKARFTILKYGMNHEEWSELSSFLCTELWCELHNKSELHNIRIVRRLINLRTVDYFRSKGRFDNQIPFCGFEHDKGHNKEETNDGEAIIFEEIMKSNVNIEDNLTTSDELKSFIETLNKREKQILTLVYEGYEKQEICEKLGVSINTPRNTMKRIRNKAIEYGIKLF
jgi:RNA polymerase sigma factor (sigma-70 family)